MAKNQFDLFARLAASPAVRGRVGANCGEWNTLEEQLTPTAPSGRGGQGSV